MTSPILHKTDLLAGYRLRERLGAGGYGEVWKAEAPGGLLKAMKLVYGRFDEARASRELKALNLIKEVRHPFLVSIERIEVVDGQLIIVNELADCSLKDRYDECIAQGLPGIPREELIRYLRDAADALDYMSQRHQLQHLDIKPENLVLVGDHCKVADFGLVKGLQNDVTMSLVGGLTPMYAAPEVFDDRPSEHSDQYSLAIVYQEMLTGTMAFPGRTPAQLAAQHISSRPRLSSLPAPDQPAVARALAKEPSARFAGSRELMAALEAASAPQATSTAPSSKTTSGAEATSNDADDSTQQRASVKRRDGDAGEDSTGGSAPSLLRTEAIGSPQFEEAKRSSSACRRRVRRSTTHQNVEDLGPIEFTADDVGLRPTVWVGIGGTAARTLRRLRRRLVSCPFELAGVPAWQTVLLDTDLKELDRLSQSPDAPRLATDTIVPIPIRRPQDYRESSRDLLRWLSRRWLYNIPRSLATEALRPLGRLALVDHADTVRAALSRALAAGTSEQSIAASLETTGWNLRSSAPRVFVVASVSGGTGGGAVLDLGYMLRGILSELGLSDDGLCALLAHSTTAKPSQHDHAIANAYATLEELFEYNVPDGGFPGDPAAGLESVDGEQGTFRDVYLVHLGDELHEDEYDAATDTLAGYLELDAASPLGGALDRCRDTDRIGDAVFAEPQLRTVALSRLGCDLAGSAQQEAQALCRRLIRRWAGESTPESDRSPVSGAAESARSDGQLLTDDEVTKRASEQAEVLGLDVESLVAAVDEGLRVQLQLLTDEQFDGLPNRLAESDGKGDSSAGDWQSYLKHAEVLLGPPAESSKAAGVVRTAVEERARHLAEERLTAIRDWIVALVDSTTGRLHAGTVATAWFRTHLKELEESAQEKLAQLEQELTATRAALTSDATTKKSSGWWRRGVKKGGDVSMDVAIAVWRLRIQALCVTAVVAMGRGLAQRLGSLNEELLHAGHNLKPLLKRFKAPSRAPSLAAADDRSGRLAALVEKQFHDALSAMTAEFDASFDADHLSPRGGLFHLASRANDISEVAGADLLSAATAAVQRALAGLDVARLFVESFGDSHAAADQLRASLSAARPLLMACGGTRRRFVSVPKSDGDEKLVELARGVVEPSPTVVTSRAHEIVSCCELGSLSVIDIANSLVDDRPDLIELAARLHTRVDVEWCRLSEVDVEEAAGV